MIANRPRLGILILNWNNPTDTLRCLHSVETSDYPDRLVLVVDNGSQDDSVGQIRKSFPELVVLRCEENLGYTGGNNLGMQYLLDQGVDYILLLNDDIVLAPDTLSRLLEAAIQNPGAAFLGPKLYALESPHQLISAGCRLVAGYRPFHRGLGEPDNQQFDCLEEVDYLSGSALLVSCRAVESIGLLDPDYFVYYEDVDWCVRARRAGYQVLFVPNAKVWHPDTSRRDHESAPVVYYTTRNSLLFIKKQHLGWRILGKQILEYQRTLLSWSIRPKWRSKRAQRDSLALGLLDFARGRVGRGK